MTLFFSNKTKVREFLNKLQIWKLLSLHFKNTQIFQKIKITLLSLLYISGGSRDRNIKFRPLVFFYILKVCTKNLKIQILLQVPVWRRQNVNKCY